jgi:DNA polymerase I-like protein with 3'-5' exonuclease and polymerase domains
MVKFVTTRKDHQVTLPTLDNLVEVEHYLKKLDYVGLDLETTGLIHNHDQILLVVVGNRENVFVIDYTSFEADQLTALFKSIRGKVIGHNLGFDLPFILHRHGRYLFKTSQIYDTLVAEQVITKGTKLSVSLDNSVKRRLGINVFDKGIRMEFIGMSKTNPTFYDRHINYAAADIEYLENLKLAQDNYITRYSQEELLSYNNQVTLVASQMKVDGMYVDVQAWTDLYYTNLKRADELEVLMDGELDKVGLKQRKKRVKQRTVQLDLLGGVTDVVNKNLDNINYSSSTQVIDIFIQLNESVPKSAKEDKNSIGEATLQQYLITNPNTKLRHFLELLLEYKVVGKRANTFGKKWVEKFVDNKSRVHPTFKVNFTDTGRFSCSNPNLQQIPSDKRFREAFVGEGGRSIFTCDYSSAELRILASLSKDQVMLDLLRTNGDLHGYAATKAYRYLFKDQNAIVDKNNNSEFRGKMKNVIFGLLYGAGVQRIAELLDINKSKAEKVYEILQKTFPQAFDYLEKVASFGVDNGYVLVDSKWNQRRWFKEFFDNSYLTKTQKSAIERYCKNTPIQAQNGQMMKKALVDVYNFIEEHHLGSRIISTVHDEMVIEIGEGEEKYSENFALLMKQAGDYFLEGIEMEAEPSIKKCWSK